MAEKSRSTRNVMVSVLVRQAYKATVLESTSSADVVDKVKRQMHEIGLERFLESGGGDIAIDVEVREAP